MVRVGDHLDLYNAPSNMSPCEHFGCQFYGLTEGEKDYYRVFGDYKPVLCVPHYIEYKVLNEKQW